MKRRYSFLKLASKTIASNAEKRAMQGARSSEIAAARLASALGILSYPVITNELLRLTTFLHSRTKQQGRLGEVLTSDKGTD